MAGFFESK